MMFWSYILVALFIAWIWVDYFRLIDIHHRNNSLLHVIVAFVLGGCSVLVVDFYHSFIPLDYTLELNGDLFNDIAFALLQVGLLEEFAKFLAFLIFLQLFRKLFIEPIDYLLFASTCALGFSCLEHLLYFSKYGPQIIHGRAILSTVGHMFDTAIAAYGIILFRFQTKKYNASILFICFGLGTLCHGLYDFLLMYQPISNYGWFLLIVYFLITISVFSTILNNSINNSPHFSYQKKLNWRHIFNRLFIYYFTLFVLQAFLLFISEERIKLNEITSPLLFTGTIVLITITRLSRFNLVKGRWEKIRLELPFKVNLLADNNWERFTIKGENYNEEQINPFVETYFELRSINPHSNQILPGKVAYMERKVVTKTNQVYYIIRVYQSDLLSTSLLFVVRAKNTKPNLIQNKYPVVGVYQVANHFDPSNIQTIKKLTFKEYAALIPRA